MIGQGVRERRPAIGRWPQIFDGVANPECLSDVCKRDEFVTATVRGNRRTKRRLSAEPAVTKRAEGVIALPFTEFTIRLPRRAARGAA